LLIFQLKLYILKINLKKFLFYCRNFFVFVVRYIKLNLRKWKFKKYKFKKEVFLWP